MAQKQVAAEFRAPLATRPARARVLGRPLAVFLFGVAVVMVGAAWARWSRPTLAMSALRLADGDADGAERRELLRIVLQQGQRSEAAADRWLGMLAAVALGDREGLSAASVALGGGAAPDIVPNFMEPSLLHLGDPMLGNIHRAWVAEASGQPAEAVAIWRQVEAQSRLVSNPLALELAQAAYQRLR